MTKFIDIVQSKIIGCAPVQMLPELTVDKDIRPSYLPNMYVYEFKITWMDIIQAFPDKYDLVKTSFVRKFQEVLYGEFRSKLIDLERLIYENKSDQAIELIRKIEEDLFTT